MLDHSSGYTTHNIKEPINLSSESIKPQKTQNQQILSIKNLFDIQSTPVSSESLISTTHESNSSFEENKSNVEDEISEIKSIEFLVDENNVVLASTSNVSSSCDESVEKIQYVSSTPKKENEDTKEVVLEVYQTQYGRKSSDELNNIENQITTTAANDSKSSLINSPPLNFNFEFDNNWSLEDLLKIEDDYFYDLNNNLVSSTTLSPDSKIEEIDTSFTKISQIETTTTLTPQEENTITYKNTLPDEDNTSNDSFENFEDCYDSSILESFKELTILEKFKNVFNKYNINSSSNVFKKFGTTTSHSNQSILELFNKHNNYEDANSGDPHPYLNAYECDESPKIKFQEFVFLDSDEKDHGHIQSVLDPSNIRNGRNINGNGNHFNTTPKLTRSHQPKRRKSFLHLVSTSTNPIKSHNNTTKTTTTSPNNKNLKSILKNKINNNFKFEFIASLKQSSIEFDEFWHKFEMNEQLKNNNYNEEILNQLRLEQVRNYYEIDQI